MAFNSTDLSRSLDRPAVGLSSAPNFSLFSTSSVDPVLVQPVVGERRAHLGQPCVHHSPDHSLIVPS